MNEQTRTTMTHPFNGKHYECKTKEELFSNIRALTKLGYFFRIENYYDGRSNRSAYMISVLSHRDD